MLDNFVGFAFVKDSTTSMLYWLSVCWVQISCCYCIFILFDHTVTCLRMNYKTRVILVPVPICAHSVCMVKVYFVIRVLGMQGNYAGETLDGTPGGSLYLCLVLETGTSFGMRFSSWREPCSSFVVPIILSLPMGVPTSSQRSEDGISSCSCIWWILW